MASLKTIWNLFLFFGGVRGNNLFPMYGKIKCPKLPLFSSYIEEEAFLSRKKGFFFSKKRLFFYHRKKGFYFFIEKQVFIFYWKKASLILETNCYYIKNIFNCNLFFVFQLQKKILKKSILYIYICFRGFWTTKNFVKFYTRTMQDPVKNNIIITLLKYFQCHHYDIRIVISFKLTFEIFFWNVYIQKNNTFTKMHFL